ncbi:hypothetical protein OIO90_002123 [Microbotryomycetes sp. JL221]|nr:hypothetical protein OIO90_002123 [Microbotryomycetes sp. JL221]
MSASAGAGKIPRVYLVSRRVDPFLGIFTGVWAYALYEHRLGRPKGHSLLELLQWKWDQRTWLRRKPVQEQDALTAADDREWAELAQEIQREQTK